MAQHFNGLSGPPPSAEVIASPEKAGERAEALRRDSKFAGSLGFRGRAGFGV